MEKHKLDQYLLLRPLSPPNKCSNTSSTQREEMIPKYRQMDKKKKGQNCTHDKDEQKMAKNTKPVGSLELYLFKQAQQQTDLSVRAVK